jgi:MYXO-CTERM domain-containing protein
MAMAPRDLSMSGTPGDMASSKSPDLAGTTMITSNTNGCSCRMSGARPVPAFAPAALGLLALALRRRRRAG